MKTKTPTLNFRTNDKTMEIKIIKRAHIHLVKHVIWTNNYFLAVCLCFSCVFFFSVLQINYIYISFYCFKRIHNDCVYTFRFVKFASLSFSLCFTFSLDLRFCRLSISILTLLVYTLNLWMCSICRISRILELDCRCLHFGAMFFVPLLPRSSIWMVNRRRFSRQYRVLYTRTL